MTNPLVSGATPQRALTTPPGTASTPAVGSTAPAAAPAAAPSKASQTAALFTTLLQNSMLDSVMAINDGSGDDDADSADSADGASGVSSSTDLSSLLGSAGLTDTSAASSANSGAAALGLDLSSLGLTGDQAASFESQLQGLLGASALGGGAAAGGAAAPGTTGVSGADAASAAANLTPDAGAAANAQTVAGVATKLGVDPVAAVAMMLVESGGNAHSVGDNGTSFGLFQLHEGGMLTAAGLTSQQAFDPATNARVSLTSLAHQYAIGPDRSAGTIAAASQRPADPAGYAVRVDAMMDRARALLAAGPAAAPGSPTVTG
jgi:hypothetical protein